jgi:SAM-dependent methyltransferase
MPFRDGSFDLILSTDVIEHIEDDVAALSELRRVLIPSGRIILTTPAYSWAFSDHDRFLHHVRRYDRARLKGAVESAGLRVVHWSRYNVLLAGPVLFTRWIGDLWPGGAKRGSDVGRPVPRLLSPVLNGIFALESMLAPHVNLRIGLTHVAVLACAAVGAKQA